MAGVQRWGELSLGRMEALSVLSPEQSDQA